MIDRTKAERAHSTTTKLSVKTEEPSVTDEKQVPLPQSKAAQNLDLVGIGAQFHDG
jgi:hypothetical protein